MEDRLVVGYALLALLVLGAAVLIGRRLLAGRRRARREREAVAVLVRRD